MRGRGVGGSLAAALLVVVGLFPAPAAAVPQAHESELRAAFVVNFLRFTHWDGEPPGPALCLWRIDPFGGTLDRIATRVYPDVTVRVIDSGDDLDGCRLLYLPRTAPPDSGLRSALDARPVLVLSERRQDLEQVALIALYLSGERLRFSVANSRARARGLNFSAKMLNLAEEVL